MKGQLTHEIQEVASTLTFFAAATAEQVITIVRPLQMLDAGGVLAYRSSAYEIAVVVAEYFDIGVLRTSGNQAS